MNKLYPISPPKIVLADFLPQLRIVLGKNKPVYFQLRLKDTPREEIIAAAKKIIPICHEYGTKFIMNDFVDIALEVNADGVHIGGDDGDVAAARKKIGNKILGVSCYNSLELAKSVAAAGADYVSFGAFYPTQTKVPKSKAEIETLKKWKAMSNVPVSVIGGINFENYKPLEAAGADFICMVSAIWSSNII